MGIENCEYTAQQLFNAAKESLLWADVRIELKLSAPSAMDLSCARRFLKRIVAEAETYGVMTIANIMANFFNSLVWCSMKPLSITTARNQPRLRARLVLRSTIR